MNDNKKMFLPALLAILLILSFTVLGKNTSIIKNINFNNTFVIYPFIFILLAYMSHSIGSKLTKKSALLSIGFLLIFLFSLSVVSLLRGDEITFYFRASLEFIFTPKHINILGGSISYPTIGNLIFFIGGYLTSSLSFISLYRALKDYTPKFVAYLMSYLISLLLNTIIYTGGNGLVSIFKKDINFNQLIINLTSNFMSVILTCIISTIIYAIICTSLNKKDKILFKNIS